MNTLAKTVYPFEEEVLGCALLDMSALDTILSECRRTDFRNANLFDLLKSLRSRNLPVDPATIAGECDDLSKIGGLDHLNSLIVSVVSTSDFPSIFRQFRQQCVKRDLKEVFNNFDKYFNASTNFDVSVLNLENDIFDITARVKSVLTCPYLDYIKSLDGLPDYTIHMPIKSLDKVLGGLNPGELCVIGARPAMGKTALVCNLAYRQALASDKVVAMYSLEMSAPEIFSRFVSLHSGISTAVVRTNSLTKAERKTMEESAKAIQKLMQDNLKLNDSHATSISGIRSSLRRIAKKKQVGLVVIDYLQLLSGGGKTMYERVTEVSRNCKLIAREFNCVVVALSQLSRAVDSRGDKHPTLSDLRESGAIEQDADQVLMLYCDSYYNPPKNFDPSRDVIDIDVAKNRHGSTGVATAIFNKVNGRFHDIKMKGDKSE